MSKYYLGIIIILICSLFFIPQYLYSSSKEDYELQVRCGVRSGEWFKKEYGKGTSSNEYGKTYQFYKNHYNKKQNKCFVLLTYTFEPNNKEKNITIIKQLMDINENKIFGSLQKEYKPESKIIKIKNCFVLEKFCNSSDEWDKLVKPYMED